MAEPQGAAPSPTPRSSNIPKINFGEIIDVPNTNSTGWTVRGMDLLTGRVALSKRDGDKVATRSVSLEEYEQAQNQINEKPGRKKSELKFRLRQQLRGGGIRARVKEYDGKTDTVLVDAVVNDQTVTKWVKRETVEKMAQKPTAGAAQALSRELLGEEKKTTKQAPEAASEETKETQEVPVTEEEESEEPTEEFPEEMEEPEQTVEETREALREERLKRVTVAALAEEVQSGTIQKEVLDEAKTDVENRIARLEERDKNTLTGEEKTELVKLKEAKKQLNTVSKYVDQKTELSKASDRLAEAKASGNTGQVSVLNKRIAKLEGGISSVQAEAIKASGKIEVSLPAIATSGEIRATLPGSMKTRIEASARVAGAPTLSVSATGGGAAPLAGVAIGAAVASSSPENLVLQAQSAVTNLDAVIGRREAGLQQLNAQISAIGNQYREVATERGQAVQRGDQGMIVQMDQRLASLSDERVNLQKQQLATTVDISAAKKTKNRLQTLANNVSAAGDEAPPELVDELRDAIPEGVQLMVDVDAEKSQAAIPPPPRSFSATLPKRAPERKAATVGGTRNRLMDRGVPLQTASAAALTGNAGDGAEYSEDVGTDAFEQALSYQGGAGELKVPSYTSARPSAEGEKEDIFQGDLKSRQDMRALEQRQTATRENLLPDSGLEQPAEEEGAQPQEEPASRDGTATPRETSRGANLASSRFRDFAREAKQKGGQEAFQALQAKQGGLSGSVGGDTSNIEGIRRLKKIWDMAKAGTGITIIGLIVTIIIMNIQMINKWIWPKTKMIPTQSIVEDFITILIDFNLTLIALIPFIIPIFIVTVVALAAGAVGYITGIF